MKSAFALFAVFATLAVSGCGDSVGDTNPVSPEQMSEMRKQRGNVEAPPAATKNERPPTGGR